MPDTTERRTAMDKDRFEYVCIQTEQGRDMFVRHPASGEEGRVQSCSKEHVVVATTAGEQRTWDYREVAEITRDKNEWPRRD
jgi:hypothetical protein